MGRIIVTAVIVAVIGLVVGYLIFGQNVAGDYIAIDRLIQIPDEDSIGGALQEIGQAVTGIREARQNILISGAVGLAVGAIIGASPVFGRRGRRRR